MDKQKKKRRSALPLQVSVTLAMLAAISIICGKYLAFGVGNVLRFSFENLPILMASAVFGPICGMAVGAVADLVGCLMVGYTINPIVTLGAVAIGCICGILWRICKKLPDIARCVISVSAAHLVGSVLIKTFGLAKFYDMPFLVLMGWRTINYLIIAAVECALLYIVMRHRQVQKMSARLNGYRKNATRVEDNDKNGEE